MEKENNIIDFNKKKDEILMKEVTDYSDVAELIIDACFSDGESNCELAKELLFDTRVVGKDEELLNTMLSMTIEAIEAKGYVDEANKLREMLSAHLDKNYEKAIRKIKDKKEDKEIYDDAEGFLDAITKEEQKRIESVVHKLFADEIDFSNMDAKEAYEILKDDAKYCFYYGFFSMRKLVLDNKRCEVSITFDEGFPLIGATKDAFAYLVNVFQEFSITKNAKNKTITANFGFHNFKKEEK